MLDIADLTEIHRPPLVNPTFPAHSSGPTITSVRYMVRQSGHHHSRQSSHQPESCELPLLMSREIKILKGPGQVDRTPLRCWGKTQGRLIERWLVEWGRAQRFAPPRGGKNFRVKGGANRA